MRIFKTILATIGAFRLTLITLGTALRTYTRYATGGEADTAFKKFRADRLNYQAKMMWDLSDMATNHGHDTLAELYGGAALNAEKRLGETK